MLQFIHTQIECINTIYFLTSVRIDIVRSCALFFVVPLKVMQGHFPCAHIWGSSPNSAKALNLDGRMTVQFPSGRSTMQRNLIPCFVVWWSIPRIRYCFPTSSSDTEWNSSSALSSLKLSARASASMLS